MKLFLWIACAVLVLFIAVVISRIFLNRKADSDEDGVPDDRYPLW